MWKERFHDAAIALHRILGPQNIRYGIFGGYAISVMQGVRSTKDIDCLVSASKDQVIRLLDKKGGFNLAPSSPEDYVLFEWSDLPDGKCEILVEIFCTDFPGATYTLDNVTLLLLPITGRSGYGESFFLDPFRIFKGKLQAAASRAVFHDTADLRTLGHLYGPIIRSRVNELDAYTVGIAIKRYKELVFLFDRLGVDLAGARRTAYGFRPDDYLILPVGNVQHGLLA
ncbi:hypothetical protein GGS26DRAFT_601501 [Hypomontagnella submonticulosa]|nr:hypothetical protein GGS26DRAFT_601501 [Hypomontagnella submonticulosa]